MLTCAFCGAKLYPTYKKGDDEDGCQPVFSESRRLVQADSSS